VGRGGVGISFTGRGVETPFVSGGKKKEKNQQVRFEMGEKNPTIAMGDRSRGKREERTTEEEEKEKEGNQPCSLPTALCKGEKKNACLR